jgi:hypothetical protein
LDAKEESNFINLDILGKLDKCIEALIRRLADKNETKKVIFITLGLNFFRKKNKRYS